MLLSCKFACHGCGFTSPLGHVDADGSVQCGRCGIEQSFDVTLWEPVLRWAHDVADVATNGHGGRESRVGSRESEPNAPNMSESLQWHRLEVTATPGHPTCDRCGVLLTLEHHPDATVVVGCPRCHDRTPYRSPWAAARYVKLVVALAEEHRTDRGPVRIRVQAGVAAASCPSCGATLPDPGDSRVMTCAYCNTTSYVPLRGWLNLHPQELPSQPFWLCFTGASSRTLTFEQFQGGNNGPEGASLIPRVPLLTVLLAPVVIASGFVAAGASLATAGIALAVSAVVFIGIVAVQAFNHRE
ncbi:MAG: hypothetical protein ACOC1F_06460 [Myxococcota bacterium]